MDKANGIRELSLAVEKLLAQFHPEAINELNASAAAIDAELKPFTETTRYVVMNAQGAALGARTRTVGSEHLLLAIIGETRSTGSELLAAVGLTIHEIKDNIQASQHSRSPGTSVRRTRVPSLGDDARDVLRLAVEEATLSSVHPVTTALVVVAIVREGTGIAGRVLRACGVDLEVARRFALEHRLEE